MHQLLPLHDPDMMRWAEPLIHDVVSAAYPDLTDHRHEALYLVRCQCMLWRALLTGKGSIAMFQDEVYRNGARFGLGQDRIEEVNRQIVTELMLVIASRHARSPRQAAEASIQVAQAYGRLAQAQILLQQKA
jgi:hypothetical protein